MGETDRSKIDARLPRATTVLPPIVTVHFDGACQPPRGGGVATYGFVIEGAAFDQEEAGLAVPPGSEHATNNVAEYTAAIRALEYLSGRGYGGTVVMLGDSQLVIRQMTGEYEVRAPHLVAYHERLGSLVRRFDEVRFEWIPRESNLRADALSKLALRDHPPRRRIGGG
ncbi:MAG TPA: ribonuclease HI [Thermoplasmata archaeon]|nr:ribonuclease HI [Thermoplasmata archaeon]